MSECKECYYLEKESLKIDIENKKLWQENTELKEKLDKATYLLNDLCFAFTLNSTMQITQKIKTVDTFLKELGYSDKECK